MQKIDETDRQLLKERSNEFNEKPGARLGDFIKLKNGKLLRITVIHEDDDVQAIGTTKSNIYLGGGTFVQHNGCCGDIICKLNQLKQTDESQMGGVWFFHHGEVGPDRRVDLQMNFRVYKIS